MGFIATLGYIFAPYFVAFIGLLSFTNWLTALLFAIGVGVFSALAVRFHEKHNRSGAYDDRLTDGKMSEACERYIREVKRRDVLEN